MGKLVIISGRSGSGKSTALHLLEDIGFYCVDNLPLNLIKALISTFNSQSNAANDDSKETTLIAIGLDARNISQNFSDFPSILKELDTLIDTSVIYLDTDEETLIKRFNATRRPHPLKAKSVNLEDALEKEHEILTPIIQSANRVINTSELNLYQLREKIRLSIDDATNTFSLSIESFGFKKGVPSNADFIFDARVLPNPYWREDLRGFSGQDKEIIEFFETHDQVNQFVEDTLIYLNKWIPKFKNNDRAELVIAIGCTGGQHRSVYVCEKIFNSLSQHYRPKIHHRDKH